MNTIIEAIGTANPSLRRSQDHAADFMSRIEALSPTARSRLRAIYERSAIEYRYSCIADYSGFDPESFEFFPPSWSLEPAPTTGDRNRKYRAEAAPLLVQAAEEALGSAGLEPVTVTHVVVVTCTGFYSPGLDVALVKGLGLRPDVRRTVVGFMGCHAAFNGLRLARSFCRSDPNACVLVACVELCTLHFNVDDSVEATVINALFSDGAAVAVLRNGPSKASTARLGLLDDESLLDDNSEEYMTWSIGDTGFEMGLSARVPAVVSGRLGEFLGPLLGRHGLKTEDVRFWAVHPGGRRIVEKIKDQLRLSDEDVHDSLEVLRLHGNMSSPTVLYVIKRILDRIHDGELQSGSHGVAMAFGPGLTLEGSLLRVL